MVSSGFSPDTFAEALVDKTPLVVRFMSPHRQRSIQLDSDWHKFSEMYNKSSDIRIGHIHCGKYRRLCLKEGEWETPSYKIYLNGRSEKYDGGMSYESLSEWTRRITGIQGVILSNDLLSPNNRTFHELINSKKCVFTMFYTPWCRKCLRFMGALKDIARAYRNEQNISICEVDADKFKSFFFDFSLRKFPAFKLFINGGSRDYTGHIEKEPIYDFLNDYCGTQRSDGGILSSDAGVIDEVSPIVEDFMRKPCAKYLQEMKNIQNTSQYVLIMENIMNHGNVWLSEERQRLNNIIASESADQNLLDSMKRRLNIISVFMGYQETL